MNIKELQKDLIAWFKRNPGISRASFARYIGRKPGTFSDLLNLAQNPKTEAGLDVWRRIENFLIDKEEQSQFRDSVSKGVFIVI